MINSGKKFKAKKAVIIARVSSKEQEEGYSIDAQLHRLENYCIRNNLEIIRRFDIVESSTQGDRRQFMEMISFVKKQKETVALVADKVDRVQRSLKEYPLLDALIQEDKLELHFNTENYVIHKESVSQERLMWSIGVIMAQSYVDSLRDNVKRSIEQKLRLGEWVSLAPLGYMNVKKNARERGELIVDPERSHFIRRMFNEYATGTLTLGQLTKKTAEWGFRNKVASNTCLSVSQVHKIMQNPFYYGMMKVKGRLYTHRYPPLIDKILFDQCQEVTRSWNKKQFKYGGKDYLFKSLLTCANSGRVVSFDTKTKTYLNGKTASWTYLGYWDANGKKSWIREDKVIAQVEDALKPFSIDADILPSVIEFIKESNKTESDFVMRQRQELNDKVDVVQNRIDRLLNLYLDGLIERDDFDNNKEKLTTQRNQLINEVVLTNQSDDRFKNAAVSLVNLIADMPNKIKILNMDEKRNVLKLVFSNLTLKDGTLCFSYNKLLNEFKNLTDYQLWRAAIDKVRTTQILRNELINLYDLYLSGS